MAMSDQSTPPVYYAVPPAPPLPPGRLRALVLIGLAGLVLGGGGVGLGWALSSHAATGADAEARAACASVQDVALPDGSARSGSKGGVHWLAGTMMAAAARSDDTKYGPLLDAMNTVDGGASTSPRVIAALRQVRGICGGVGR
jgi:hypothetical protein